MNDLIKLIKKKKKKILIEGGIMNVTYLSAYRIVMKIQPSVVPKCQWVLTAVPLHCHWLATRLQPGCHWGTTLPEASDMLGSKGYDVYYKATLAGLARRPAISFSP